MKQLFTFFIILVCSTIAFSQPTIQWQYSYGGTAADGMNQGNGGTEHVQPTPDGGYVIASAANSNDGDVSGHHGATSKSDIWVFKIDSLGSIEWQNSLGGSNDEWVYGIESTNDGGYIMIGHTSSSDGDVTGFNPGPAGDETDVWVVKIDSLGNLNWQHTYGGAGRESGRSITETPDGGYVFVGFADSTDGDVSGLHAKSDVWMAKIDGVGNLLWQHCFGGSNFEHGRDVKLTNDNGFVITAITSSSDGDAIGNVDTMFLGSTWVIKTDSLGNIEWQDTYGGTWFEFGQEVWNLPDGTFLFGAYTQSTDGTVTAPNHGSSDYWVLKLDNMGGVLWNKCYGGSSPDQLHTLRLTNDGGFLAFGESFSNDGDVSANNGFHDYWLFRADSSGNLLWEKSLGGSDWEYGKSVLQTNDGGYLVVGESSSNDGDVSGHHGAVGISDVWVVKLSPVPTGVDEVAGNISTISIAPNPVADQTTLQFELLENDHVRIDLMDISSRVVQNINNSNLNTGINQFIITTNDLENGLYLIRISTGKSMQTIKLIKN